MIHVLHGYGKVNMKTEPLDVEINVFYVTYNVVAVNMV